MTTKIHVAVGVIKNNQGQYLISKRLKHLHQGDLWEFPGGKVEPNESAHAALCRELYEELHIDVLHAEPLIKISHAYPDKQVLLDVWLVDDFSGNAVSQQQQPLQWVAPSDLHRYSFPAANKGILCSLFLPSYYAITGEFENTENYLQCLHQCLESGIKLIQLRNKKITEKELLELATISKPICKQYGAKLLVNAAASFLEKLNIDGIHLSSKQLLLHHTRPISGSNLLAASVHDKIQLQHAINIGVDFVVVSPVLKTKSHPDATLLDWSGLETIVSESSIPVFSLGGMKRNLLSKAKQTGAIGIAAISEFWC